MILANLRERLTPTDVNLVVRLLARGDQAHEEAVTQGRSSSTSPFATLCAIPGSMMHASATIWGRS